MRTLTFYNFTAATKTVGWTADEDVTLYAFTTNTTSAAVSFEPDLTYANATKPTSGVEITTKTRLIQNTSGAPLLIPVEAGQVIYCHLSNIIGSAQLTIDP